jgi:hypothetical protein
MLGWRRENSGTSKIDLAFMDFQTKSIEFKGNELILFGRRTFFDETNIKASHAKPKGW